MKKLKIGIVGMGTIGNVHANALKNVPGVEIAAVCDMDKARVDACGDRLGVKARFTDYADLMKSKVDAVFVCVGNTLHREVAVAALKAGAHVLVEKPMAMNAADAQAIVTAAGRARKVLQVGMVQRQNPTCKVVREYVRNGTFGEIYHMRAVLLRQRGIPGLGGWFTTKAQSGGGPMIDIGVHWFDLAMWLSDRWNPTSVSAKTYAKFGPRMKDYKYVSMWAGPPNFSGVFDVEDYATGFVRFGAAATMSFEISWAGNTPDEGYVELLGDKAGIRASPGGSIDILTEHGDRPATIKPQFDARANPFESQAAAFVAACRGEGPPAATGPEGVTVMKLIDAIYASSAQDKEVAIV